VFEAIIREEELEETEADDEDSVTEGESEEDEDDGETGKKETRRPTPQGMEGEAEKTECPRTDGIIGAPDPVHPCFLLK
jgi:hypothetical protein